MAITVTLPIAAPTGLSATLQNGGSLLPNTTYYYVVIAYSTIYLTANIDNAGTYHSPISTEGSFTTDTVNKSVKINWTNVSGAVRYQVLLTKTSGDYTASGGYGGIAGDSIGNISDGVTGLTITSISTSNVACHSYQMKNNLLGNLPKHTGTIQVDFSGSSNYTDLKTVYDAIISAGFSDYVYYDGYNFYLKGFFTSSSGTGSLVVYAKRISFLRGGLVNTGTFVFQFGRWISDIYGADYYNGCDIDVCFSRKAFFSRTSNTLRLYGCRYSYGKSLLTTIPETLSFIYYMGGASDMVSYYVDGFKDSIISSGLRSYTSNVIDAKFSYKNNFGNEYHNRAKILDMVLLPYSTTPKGFYNCNFVSNAALQFYSGVGGGYNTSGHNCNFYDNLFPYFPNNMVDIGYLKYTSLDVSDPTSNQYITIFHSINLSIIDDTGTTVSGVTIQAIDGNNDPAVWVEHDGTIDRYTTGNTYTTDRISDSNGKIDYYLKAYKLELNPANTTYPISYDTIKTNYYPYTIIVSKEGYETSQIIINPLNERKISIVTLMPKQGRVYLGSTEITKIL